MSASTPIQWCDSTVNPIMGCDGCELWSRTVKKCYAGKLHVQRGGRNPGYAPNFEQVTRFPGRMKAAAKAPDLTGRARLLKPWLDGSPRLIFVSDMGDALSASVPFYYLQAEIVATATTPQGRRHRWLWLTKRPDRMAKFSNWLVRLGISWPTNLWAGTSVTMQKKVDRARHLLDVGDDRTVRFLSVEPQWEPIEFGSLLGEVDWAIQGGESGAGAEPFDMAWARELRTQCRKAGTPYFLKQFGAHVIDRGKRAKLQDGHGGDWNEWPSSALRVRQVPTVIGARGMRKEIIAKARADWSCGATSGTAGRRRSVADVADLHAGRDGVLLRS